MDDNKTWQGMPVASESHKKGLDIDSAMHEFKERMPRGEAEKKAHANYVHGQHIEGAAHHLLGLKGAQATGDKEEAKKHWALYEMHNKALGHPSVGEPHPEVKAHMEKGDPGIVKFKPHKSDVFVLNKQ